MPNYDEMVDYVTRKFEDRGQTPDPAAVMRVSARIIKKQGVQVDANHMAGLSDAARRRLAAPTQNGTAPGSWERVKEVAGEYGSGVADALNVAGKTISLGSTAAVGGVALPFVSNETGARWSDTVRQQASDLGVAQERAGGLNSAAGAMMAGPLAPAAILGGVAQKGAQMQEQGQNPTDLANRINLGGTAALQTGLTAAGAGVGAGAARLGTVAGGTAFGLRGVAGQAALAGTGAAAGLAATGAQAGLDYATGNEQFAPGAEDYLVNAGMNAAVPAMAMARTGVAGALRAAEGRRQVNMDQLLAAKQGDAALADAAANDAAVSKRIDLEDAQQQAVAKAQEALSTTPEVASERARIDADIRQAQYEGVAGAVDNTSVADRILRERMAADREAFNAADQEQYAREQAQQDAEMAQRDAEAQTLSEVLPPSEAVNESVSSYSSPYLQKSPLDGPLSNKSAKEIEGMFVADAAIGDKHLQRLFKEDWEKAKKQLNRTGEINDNLLNKHNVDLGTNSPDYAAIYQYGYDARDYRKELSNLQEAENLQSPEDMGYFLINNLSDTLSKSGDTLSGKLSNQAMVLVSDKIRAAGLDPVEVMRKAGADQISSGLRTVKEVNQIAEVIQSQMEQRIKKSVGKNTQPSEASLFIDTAADTAPVQEGTPVQAPEPRYLVEPATGKARLVTDRMTVDPKETVAYSDLTPEQKNRVDVAAKNLSRRVAGRDVTRSGAAINPAIPLVEGMQALGKGAKVVGRLTKRGVGRIVDNASEALSGDRTHTGRAVRTVMEMIGDDSTDRLKRSSSAPVRDAGDRINQAIEESHIAQQRMHKAMETARTGAATMDASKAKALHEADQPSRPMDPKQEYANSPWKMMLEGKLEVPENLQQFVDAKDLANQSTRDEALAAGVPIGKGTGKNVFIRHFTGDTHGILASGSDSVLGSKFVRAMSELNGVAPEQIKKDFFGLDALGKGAGVRLDPMEIGRKYKEFPSHLRDGDNYIRLLETDPSRYVRSTFEGTARRIGFYKAFGGAVDVSDLSKLMPQLNGVADAQKAAVVRAINAYNGFGELRWNAGDRGAVEGINNAKRVVGSLLTSATAPVDVSEVVNIVNHVPLTYALEGLANGAVRNKRAVAEGGLDSDVKNRVDLRGAMTQATGNFAAGVQRAAGRNIVNRYTHTVGYEGGRAWAKHLQEEGVTLLDEGFLTMNRVSPEMQARFREKRASDTDVKVLATMIAENMTGAKRNLAQTARGSRLEIVNTMGALFRRYGENRVRNMLRTIDGAKAIIANEKAPMRVRLATASAMLAQSAAGLGVSASAATAIGTALTYGISALGMFWESKESNIPLLANVVGGAVPGSMLNYMSRDSSSPGVAVASMLSWPVMVGNLVYTAASKGEPSRLFPAARRVKEALSSDDRGGKLAQQIMYSAASKLYGSRMGAAEQSDDAKARSDFRKRLLAGDEDGAQAVLSSYLPTLSEADKKKFLRGLPYVSTFGTKRMAAILEAMPLKARRYIMRHDSDAKRIVEQFTREE
jgi:hypothetical protein